MTLGYLDPNIPTITKVDEAQVSDGKGGWVTVRKDDLVTLKDPDDRIMREFMEGDGPYAIRWIGQWRCGRHALHFEPRGQGANTHYFKAAVKED